MEYFLSVCAAGCCQKMTKSECCVIFIRFWTDFDCNFTNDNIPFLSLPPSLHKYPHHLSNKISLLSQIFIFFLIKIYFWFVFFSLFIFTIFAICTKTQKIQSLNFIKIFSPSLNFITPPLSINLKIDQLPKKHVFKSTKI